MRCNTFVRVGAYQANPNQSPKEKLIQILKKAEKDEIDFLCLPEGFLTGYYSNLEEALTHSLTIEDLNQWVEMTEPYSTTLIVGFNERQGYKLYDSAAIIENGKLIGIQRKHYLYHSYFTPADQFQSFISKGITFGVTICLDTNYFEPTRLLALQGATLIFSPQCNKVEKNHPYSERPSYFSHLVARAHENRCWIVTADWHENDSLVCPGSTVIYDPEGKEIKRSTPFQDDLIVHDIPLDLLHTQKGRRLHGSPQLQKIVLRLT